MGWVHERLEGTDSSQLYKFKFLALKGSSFYIFSTPPVKKKKKKIVIIPLYMETCLLCLGLFFLTKRSC